MTAAPKYTSVDELQAQTSLEDAARKCGVPLDAHGGGRQVRMDCPFQCAGDHIGRREISVDTGNPQKVFACHAYGCQVRGNLLTLMHGWLNGRLPAGGKLKGDEFKKIRDVLAGTDAAAPAPTESKAVPKKTEARSNVPLVRSSNDKARELATLDDKFLRDVATMPPAAASYVRRHPCLTPLAMAKWRVGVLPADGGQDKRAWSLRGQLVYAIAGEDSELLAWVARDPQFETKEQAYVALSAVERSQQKCPAKHRFPVDFHRGLELYGQPAGRLHEPGYRQCIADVGILIVEGFNDVIGLDNLGVPAVGIMSNKLTDEQAAKVERWAKRLAGGRVSILFDADEAGDAGAKEAHWLFAQRGLDVRLAWSRSMHGGQFAGRQPETLRHEEWDRAIRPVIAR